MEPTIYKPGAYKSPGIYNGSCGIYKGRGVYNEGKVPIDFLYITYFKNLDTNTLKDYPLKGNETHFINSEGGYNYPNVEKVTDVIYNYAVKFSSTVDSFKLMKFFENVGGVFSIEMLYKYSNDYCDFGLISTPNVGSSVNDAIGCGYTDQGNTIYINKSYSYNLFNGTSYLSVGQRRNFRVPLSLNIGDWFLFSFILNFDEKKCTLYINGVRYIEITSTANDFFNDVYYLASLKNQSFMTQLCVRNGDLSTNGGDNYPMQNTPYFNI